MGKPRRKLDGAAAAEAGHRLITAVAGRVERQHFIKTLFGLLREYFDCDRLSINLYDPDQETLDYFAQAEGAPIQWPSPIRPAEVGITVGGHVVATRQPVVITDFSEHFSRHPIAQAGLSATMGFPLFLGEEIMATMHYSFLRKPENLYEIAAFLIELSGTVAACLAAIMALEHKLMLKSAHPFGHAGGLEKIVCRSQAMREIMQMVKEVAELDLPVLVLGETGTGKTLICKHLHRMSPRRKENFVRVNCPSLSAGLFESELFGHVKGAFTGAVSARRGRFELAHKGTLFLDELVELAPEMQSKLLQVLEDSRFERVGESDPMTVDVRLVAATNAPVRQALESGRLRADLYHRLSVYVIELPPLRERLDDIPALAASLAMQAGAKLGRPNAALPREVLAQLRGYAWPGNVRELRNVVHRLVIQQKSGRNLSAALVRSALGQDGTYGRVRSEAGPERYERPPGTPGTGGAGAPGSKAAALISDLPKSLREVEREHIRNTLRFTGGVVAGAGGAAALLGLPRTTLLHKMAKLGLDNSGREGGAA